VALRGTRTYLAVDASSVTAAEVVLGVKGPRLRTLAHQPLPAGAVTPGALGRNLADVDSVRAATGRVLAGPPPRPLPRIRLRIDNEKIIAEGVEPA